jgi:photosystem II stability/assembly factor-like uncharacterized protein
MAWNFGLLDLNVFSMAISPGFAEDETLFVGTESGIFHSTNGGRAWQETAFELDLAPVLCLALSPGYADDETLFAGTASSGLLRSADGGQSWQTVGLAAQDRAVNAIVLSPQFPGGPDILVLVDDALVVSRDGGASWSEWPRSAIQAATVTVVAAPDGLDPEATLLVGLAHGGVVRI